ncbi:uncharacterized protein A1O9_06704 [Exophiala aquamarina CBS 119918]|uniref:Glycosyl hydrolase family 32 N-terminal domain-containing protein n=1 Tax=Exophiala aquamarina CBS 119918 TaxID=1182545 RepID=A0A072P9S2_9EURO|nr:uncharacterized protein A1O9_06704 [Exophiala aquamarina CBS 119918]KEF56517.1 hypothetical protein A1O9_06704 [Exophiala aquamarina CBS 119918]
MRNTTHFICTLLTLVHASTSLGTHSSRSLPFTITKDTIQGDPNHIFPIFPILPFIKHHNNPILTPNPSNKWESAYVYNPTAIVLNSTIFLLYRAQDSERTSSIGLAWSNDGYNFTRLDDPIIYPTEPWEAGGGTEDPRIVRVNGTFYLTYTGYDLNTPQLCIATSEDLLHWTKYPPTFPGFEDVALSEQGEHILRVNHTKSAAIITEPTADGMYHMYFGDSLFYHATSTDLLHWTPNSKPFARPAYPWENGLIEPGPAPVRTRDGRWLLIYNAMTTGAEEYRTTQYSVGQMLIDPSNPFEPQGREGEGTQSLQQQYQHQHLHHERPPTQQQARKQRPLARLETPFLVPSTPEEERGQVDLVVFAEGLVQFKGQWFLYYGQADQTLGVAVADVQP